MKQATFKKIELLELNDAYRKVLYWFFSYPLEKISLSDLVKLVNISKTTANRVVLELSKQGFLKIEELGNVWRISCNQSHPYNISKKIPYNLEMIYDSGVIEAVLTAVPNARAVILFGSYRKGDDIETSDIDIAVEALDNEPVKIFNLGVIPQLGFRKNVAVNMLKFSRNKIDMNLFANISNGIVVYGFFEVRP